MKLKKIGIIISLLMFSFNSQADNLCLEDKEINYNLDFLSKDTLLDKSSIVSDFKKGVACYKAPKYNKTGQVFTQYSIGKIKYIYDSKVNLGEQAFFLNNKIPENSILYTHPTIPILLFQEQYLKKDDIGDYYMSFEKTDNVINKESTKITYFSPYDFFKLSLQLVRKPASDTIVYEFSSKRDINLLKNKIEEYFLSTVQKNNLPLKLENKNDLEVMRVYLKDNLNSLIILEPFIKIFLDHIDYNNLNFSSNIKLELIDNIYTKEKEVNPLTIFGKNILISYTFDKKRNKGLIAFSFIRDETAIINIENEFIN